VSQNVVKSYFQCDNNILTRAPTTIILYTHVNLIACAYYSMFLWIILQLVKSNIPKTGLFFLFHL